MAGFSIGLNWYLTPDETHNSDGRHVNYLYQDEYRACNPALWTALGSLVRLDNREVRYMESDDILQATFFSDCLDFRRKKKAKRIELRSEWFAKSLDVMAGNEIVCVDPDNGLVVSSAKGKPKENKYVLPEELASYYAQGSTVVYYQHKARYKDEHYIGQLEELLRREYLQCVWDGVEIREGLSALLHVPHPAEAQKDAREGREGHARNCLGRLLPPALSREGLNADKGEKSQCHQAHAGSRKNSINVKMPTMAKMMKGRR